MKTHPFTCASYNPFEVIHLDHVGPLPVDSHGNEYILVIIDAFLDGSNYFRLDQQQQWKQLL